MTNEEHATITQTAPDGTETVIEITQTKPDDAPGEDQSLVEEIYDALFDDAADTADADTSDSAPAAEPTTEPDAVGLETAPGDTDIDTTLETGTDPVIDPVEATPQTVEPALAASPTSETEETAETDETAEAEIHTQAARDAQDAADQFVASGDYQAAADARETAENEAFEAGDSNVLHGSNSTDLADGAYQQQNADYYEQQEAAHAQQGDYEAAKEDASNAAYATGNADWQAGGADHTGQAKGEETQMDWAVWEGKNADYDAQSAEEFAARGDFDHADEYADQAATHQAAADYHGDLGEHGGDMAVYDASSEVASGGTYEAADTSVADHSYDSSGTDFSSE